MTARVSLTIDCANPDDLLPFWCAALGYIPQPAPDGHDTWRAYYLSLGESEESLGTGDACDRIVDPDGIGPTIWFQVVPEPKTTKNRVHLDVHRTDPTAPWKTRHEQLALITTRLTNLGGRLREPLTTSPDDRLVCKINDPEGNEICIL